MAAWILVLLVSVLTPRDTPRESEAETRARYADIAADVAAVVQDAEPLPGSTREQSASVLVAVGYKESAFSRAVDRFEKRGPAGECGLWQTMPVNGKCPESRRAAAAIALEMMRRSFNACSANAVDERLAVYTGGACDRGLVASRDRMRLARTLYVAHPPPRKVAAR